MCGNGIRCVAKYVYDHGICPQPATADRDRGRRVGARAGSAWRPGASAYAWTWARRFWKPHASPRPCQAIRWSNVSCRSDGQTLQVTCVSMGNPHCIVFVERATDELVLGLGPQIETDPHFPAKVNVEFVEVVSRSVVRQRTWERGSGRDVGLRHGGQRRLRRWCAGGPHGPPDPESFAGWRSGTAMGRCQRPCVHDRAGRGSFPGRLAPERQ